MRAYINGFKWEVEFTDSTSDLARSDGSVALGVTDKNTGYIYLSSHLKGALLRKVLLHELCHAFIFSYGYYLTVEEEEFLCCFVDSYAYDMVTLADSLLDVGINVKYM